MNPNKIKQLAEKMGWKLRSNPKTIKPGDCWMRGDKLVIYPSRGKPDRIWDPESSDADMVDLLEKLLGDGFQITLSAGSGYFSINSLTNEATLRAAVVALACRCWGIEE